jgi:hypothetical protein
MRIAGTVLLALTLFAGPAGAASLAFDFDGVASGAAANGAVGGAPLRFDLASFLPELDAFGDPIPGSEAYRPDPEPFDLVRVSDPSARGYGAAPSGLNALDALDQGVLITFDAPVTLAEFAATLDQSAFGFPGVFDVVFQDADGAVLYSLPTQQSVPGFAAAFSGTLHGVSSIYLPGGAFYDDLGLETVPEPESLVILACALGALATARRRSH